MLDLIDWLLSISSFNKELETKANQSNQALVVLTKNWRQKPINQIKH
jgi:hypothetical protein